MTRGDHKRMATRRRPAVTGWWSSSRGPTKDG